MKNLPKNKNPGPDGLIGDFYPTFTEVLTPFLLKLSEYSRGRNTPKLIVRCHHHPDTKPDKDGTKKENYRPVSLMNIDAKILNKVLANRIQQHIKRIIHHDQVRFIPGVQGFFNMHKSINVIHHINK